MPFLQNKKLVILVGFFLVFLVVFIVSLFFPTKKPLPGNISLTPTVSIARPTVTVVQTIPPVNLSATPLPATFTGDSGEEVPESVAPGVKDSYQLQKKLPITTADFTLTYNFEQIKFSVALKVPAGESKQKFLEWLKENGYDSIPQGEFIYTAN